VVAALRERNQVARELFAPIAQTYDRYAALLSFGQDPRWRSFLVSRIEAGPNDVVLDVATGTGAVALALAQRYGCAVTAVDQSPEMLAVAKRRLAAARTRHPIRLVEARAEALPFDDASFDALTFTYLLRYVEDPAARLRELARVVRPGGRIASLEFSIPQNPLARASWEAYVRLGLPLVGRLISPGWRDVGRFLGASIKDFYARYPPERLLLLWRSAGVEDVRVRHLSFGGGVVIWGVRGR
jgi:demethylmenaquinone methyltransferase / 2-methoxy-6-polyprenyl-1,4-benzoquinol methylase